MKLQAFLNTQGAKLPVTGYFGPMTTIAVNIFQQNFVSDILAPLGLTRGTGSVYAATLRVVNKIACGGVEPKVADSVVASTGVSTASLPFGTTQGALKKPKVMKIPATIAKPKSPASGWLFGGVKTFFPTLAP